jgi:hypothetical protein
MRNVLVIVLISVHLFGNTELGQLIKLPQLITHYNKHHRDDPSVNFIQFLIMHYAGDDGTTADDKEDMQLPCHDYHNTGLFFVLGPAISMEPCPDQVFYCCEVSYRGLLLTPYSSGHIFSFLQPPRIA